MSYTDSALVTYTDINGNYNPRSDAAKYGCIGCIDTITLHHMAGNLTVETCGRVFHNKAGSSNYGVNGKNIGLYVHEKDRSWCSASRQNDFRAITIEIANNSGAPNWTVSDESLKTTINLLVDICKRNAIPKLVWSDNKLDRINHRNGCNMTMHQDFASTACPGPYVSGKEAYIAAEVNKLLGGAAPIPEPAPTPAPATAVPTYVSDESIKGVQTFLNTYYSAGLNVDGLFGPNTRKAIAKAYQTELNRMGAGLNVDGFFGGLSAKAFDKYVGCLKQDQKTNIFCTLWQCTLVGFGYKPNGIDGIFGKGCANATNLIFKHTGLPQDATVHSSDIDKLM